MSELPGLGRLLDTREERDGAIAEAVWIPLSELRERMHELPPKHNPVVLAGPAPEAEQFLRENGRAVEVVTDWSYGADELLRLWEPNPFLMEVLPGLPVGTALDLACGAGREAVAMAAHGWQVMAVDRFESALEKGRDLARRYLPPEAASRIVWRALDLDASPLYEPEAYGLVTMFFYLNRDLIRHAHEWLRPGGSLAVETFTPEHQRIHGKPKSPQFLLQSGELATMNPNLELMKYEEGWLRERHTARMWATLNLD